MLKFILVWLVTWNLVLAKEDLISSPVLTNEGSWKSIQRCPPGTFVVAYDLATHTHSSPQVDDVLGIVSIIMQCSKPNTPELAEAYITSILNGVKTYLDGVEVIPSYLRDHVIDPIEFFYVSPLKTVCRRVATGFQMNTAGEKGSEDNSGANNLRMFCSGLRQRKPNFVEGYGSYLGDWTESQHCGLRQAICGMQVQAVEPNQEYSDHIGIENVRLLCCDLPNPASPESCTPTIEWELLEMNAPEGRKDISCSFSPRIKFTVISKQTVELNKQFLFNEGVGFSIKEDQDLGVIRSVFHDNVLTITNPPFGYDWANTAERNWHAVIQQQEYDCSGDPAGNTAFTRAVTIYQLVAKCSYFSSRSGRFRRIEATEFIKNGTVVEKEIRYGS